MMRRRKVEAYRDAELESVVEYPEVSVPTNTLVLYRGLSGSGTLPEKKP